MKKYLTLFCLILFTNVFGQKNNIEAGIPIFNHFDGYGFTATRYLAQKTPASTIKKVVRSLHLGYEYQFNDKKSIKLAFNQFAYTYLLGAPTLSTPHGLAGRQLVNINVSYRQRLISLMEKRITFSGAIGVDYRSGAVNYFWGFRDVAQREAWYSNSLINDFGISIGVNAKLKLSQRLFINVQSDYVYYLLGIDLGANYNGNIRNRQVLSACLSLGYRF